MWSYQAPLDAVIAGLKFRRLDYLGKWLGRAAFEWLRAGEQSADAPAPELVVPVPLHWSRRLARGYNQAALIAAPIAAGFGVPVAMVVRRHRRTPQQTRLDRAARLVNPKAAFTIRPGDARRVAGRSILIVDDVITTGATLTAVATVLQRAGARHILGVALARTA